MTPIHTLNALGNVSGLASFLNDSQQLEEIKQNLKFAASLEAIKHAEKECKRVKTQKLLKKHYQEARKKVNLSSAGIFYKYHAAKLTIAQMKAVATLDFQTSLNGKAAVIRAALVDLLPAEDEDLIDLPTIDAPEHETPEYATQDEVYYLDLALEDMEVGESVEVYWKGDKVWYEGRVVAVDMAEKQFEVFYFLDEKQLVHNAGDYKVRQSC